MKSLVFKIALFLLVGGIVNVGVAWACAIVPRGLINFYDDSETIEFEDEPEVPRDEWYPEWRVMPAGERERMIAYGWQATEDRQFGGVRTNRLRAITARLVGLRIRRMDECHYGTCFAISRECHDQIWAGWPVACMSGERVDVAAPDPRNWAPPEWQPIGAIALPDSRLGQWYRQPLLLPLRPMPVEFAVNTAAYASGFWLVVCGPGLVRRVVRRRRGLCAACGYAVGHAPGMSDVCSECGETVAVNTI